MRNHLERTDLCVKPWAGMNIAMDGIRACCYTSKVMEYPHMAGGPYVGENPWNSPGVVESRRRHLETGVLGNCPRERLCYMREPHTVDEQLEDLRSRYGESPVFGKIREAISEGRTEVDFDPVLMEFFIGHGCNADCIFCSQRYLRGRGLPPVLTDDMVKGISGMFGGLLKLYLVGGDLFAHDDEVIDKILSCFPGSRSVETTTNGRGLTPDRWERLVRNGPLSSVAVSLDTTNPGRYHAHRQRPLQPTLGNLERICRENRWTHRIGAVSSVVTSITLSDLPDLVGWAVENRVGSVVFMTYTGRSLEDAGLGRFNLLGEGWSPGVAATAERVGREIELARAGSNIAVNGYGVFLDKIRKKATEHSRKEPK